MPPSIGVPVLAILPGMYLPDMPESAHVFHAEEALPLRYDDVCQDGRLMLTGMPHALTSVWRACVRQFPLSGARSAGVIPILAQLWVRGTDARIHVGKPARSVGTGVFTHVKASDGSAQRILLDMRASIYGITGSVLGPQSEGEEVLVGEVFARHVLTKLFAPPGQRRVRELDIEGMAPVPPTEVLWHSPESMMAVPDEVSWLEPSAESAALQPLFGLQHTDSNQHVNSLAYPRLFEEAAQLRFSERELQGQTVAREVAVNFRRPFFAGQRSRVDLRAFENREGRGCVGAFIGADEKIHCDMQMRFR